MDVCFPEGADWSCALDQQAYDSIPEDVRDRSEALAWSTLAALTGYRLSLCPTTVQPCAARCVPGTWITAPTGPGGTLTPFVNAQGNWVNGCGCTSRNFCNCSALCEVILPTPVGDIASVSVGGSVLDASAYRVDNGNRLVRTDGECWPLCPDEPAGPFLVSYYPGVAPNDLFRYAAGVLAVEFYRACSNQECRLPSGVTNITQAGMTMTVEAGTFPGGMTGIQEVDAVIRTYNPFALKAPSRVLSPDNGRARVRTWGA